MADGHRLRSRQLPGNRKRMVIIMINTSLTRAVKLLGFKTNLLSGLNRLKIADILILFNLKRNQFNLG